MLVRFYSKFGTGTEIVIYFIPHSQNSHWSDIKAVATWEVDGTGSITGLPFSMYLLSGIVFSLVHL